MTALRLHAPAKVNLYLLVLGRRPDGYHEVETCLHALALADELTAERGGEGVQLTVRRRTEAGFDVPDGPDNLVYRAASAFRAATGETGGVRFSVEKRIPAGAGLGGGSSDAATALLLLDALFDRRLPASELHRLAAGLGADVPFFLRGGTRIGTGVGDRLEPVDDPPRLHFVLVLPPFGLSTAEVYRRCVCPRLTGAGDGTSMRRTRAVLRGGLAVPERFVNELEPAAMEVEPRLARLRDRIRELGFPSVRMSGSGSALFVAFGREEEATAALETLRPLRGEGIVLVRTRSEGDVPRVPRVTEGDWRGDR